MLELTHWVTTYATCKYLTWELVACGVSAVDACDAHCLLTRHQLKVENDKRSFLNIYFVYLLFLLCLLKLASLFSRPSVPL